MNLSNKYNRSIPHFYRDCLYERCEKKYKGHGINWYKILRQKTTGKSGWEWELVGYAKSVKECKQQIDSGCFEMADLIHKDAN